MQLRYILIYNKVSINARSDWLKQRALSENRARVDDGKLITRKVESKWAGLIWTHWSISNELSVLLSS